MSGDTNTSGAGTGTPDAGEATKALQGQLAEQRSIQAGLDTKIANLTTERNGLTEQLATSTGLSTTQQARITELEQLGTQAATALAELQTQHSATLSERDGFQVASLAHEETAARFKIVADVAREHPSILTLAAEGALPSADTHEAFRESLTRIGTGIGGAVAAAADATVAQAIGGARPDQAPASLQTVTSANHWRLMLDAQKAGDTDEYERLRALWTGSLGKQAK